MKKELGAPVDMETVKLSLKKNFEIVFGLQLS